LHNIRIVLNARMLIKKTLHGFRKVQRLMWIFADVPGRRDVVSADVTPLAVQVLLKA